MSHNCYKNIKVGDYLTIEGAILSAPVHYDGGKTLYNISGQYCVVYVKPRFDQLDIILGSNADVIGPYKSYSYWKYDRDILIANSFASYSSYLFIDTGSEKRNILGEYEKIISIHKNNEKEEKEIAQTA